MEYLITRLYADGVRMPHHVQRSASTRGALTMPRLAIEESVRGTNLVASVHPSPGERPILDLCDVRLLGTQGGSWALGGYEETPSGPVARARRSWQVWLVEPVAAQETINMARRVDEVSQEAHELRARLASLEPGKG